jgi:hypothetical protein
MKLACARYRIAAACCWVALLASGAAHAAFVSAVDISLIAPGGIVGDSTPINLHDSVTPVDGNLLLPGDGSNIGTMLLPSESIGLQGETFVLRIAQGATDGTTGYLGDGLHDALYQFSGLQLDNRAIVGLFASVSGLTSPTNIDDIVQLISPTSFIVNLSNLVFLDRGHGESLNYADLRVGFLTTPAPVPLPDTIALLASGLLLLAFVRRQRLAAGGH